ncbi:hypothetical protein QCA50_002229 [Cerrena zonata]|uniref:RING-type domain-containing protein n=1 Tax=Cerrena zonata TaxID=2478898 RepID=A0AAW0GYT4_9APHY
MSTREPMWYCYECHSEMRPLMVPDPHCASCNGTFVEKMENPADDPRNFQAQAADPTGDEDPFGPRDFLFGLSTLLNAGGMPSQNRTGPSAGTGQSFPERGQTLGGRATNTTTRGTSSGFSIRIDRTGTGPARTIITGGAPTSDSNGGNGQARIPLLSEFVQRAPPRGGLGDEREMITGPLMFQYLINMLSQGRNGPGSEFPFPGMMPPGSENGRWGDYVFNQDALDQIISQLMENSSSHPVPATEEIINNLPKDTLSPGSPLLQKDCAVCKDQFQLNTDDPAEQVVVTLPCKHPFHEPCITPWLKSSGTCPVCRYELVPQPHHGGANNTPGGSSSSNNRPNGPSSPSGSNSPPQGGHGQSSILATCSILWVATTITVIRIRITIRVIANESRAQAVRRHRPDVTSLEVGTWTWISLTFCDTTIEMKRILCTIHHLYFFFQHQV